MAAGIRKNDIVIVRQGKDKGKTGKVLSVDPDKGRALVEGVHMVKEFIRPDRSKNRQGGILAKESPVPLSRLMLYCDECQAGVRVRSKRLEDGSHSRICPRCEAPLDKSK